jgi:hypothetical protein
VTSFGKWINILFSLFRLIQEAKSMPSNKCFCNVFVPILSRLWAFGTTMDASATFKGVSRSIQEYLDPLIWGKWWGGGAQAGI